MLTTKICSIYLLFSILFLSACGGGSSGTTQTAKDIAIEKIAAYAKDASNPAPILQDYLDAGVSGVNSSNLAEINTVVDRLEAEDVDSVSELEALTTQLGINISPIATAGTDKTVAVNKSITITGSGSDSDGSIASYAWKKGSTVLASTASFSYTPTTVGTDTLTLTVTDNDGATATDTMNVVVTATPNIAPTANAGADKTVEVNKSITITGSGSDSDGSIASYAWKKGSTVLASTASFNYTPTTVGTDTLMLTVTDNDGATATDTMNVVVTATPNIAPTANAGADKKVIVGESIAITGTANDSDGTIVKYEWKNGSTVLATTASFDYTSTATGVTTDTLTLTVTDDDGDSSSDSMNVMVGIQIPDSNRFLTFVNTGKVDANDDKSGNDLIATNYYQKIDPEGRKTTLDNWYIENCYKPAPTGYQNPPNCNDDFGSHAFAIYLNNVDLNLGRRMSLRSNSDQIIGTANNSLKDTVSSCVENYSSIEAATNQVGVIASVCMEYGPPDGNPSGKKFTKFFTYGPTGDRILKVDLDGRGEKYQPGMCLTCHGGDPASATDIGDVNGDTNAGFIPWDLNNFKFSTSNPLYTREVLEDEFKKLNQGALLTYETFDSPNTEAANATRELIRGWYNFTGDFIPQSSIFNGEFTPSGWAGKEALYHDVVVPSCRACHIQRGLTSAASIDFSTYTKFKGFYDQINDHVYKQGTMPLAKRTFDLFWDNLRPSNQAEILWTELSNNGTVTGDVNIPGKPIPKIDDILTPTNPFDPASTITFDGRSSLFATTYQWSVSSPGATTNYQLTNADTSLASFNLTGTPTYGSYTFRLTVKNSSGDTEIADKLVNLVDARTPLDFSNDIYPIIQSNCFSCHEAPGAGGFDISGNNVATYNEVISRINLGTPANSLLLVKASGGGAHGGATVLTVGSANYNKILEWIDVDDAAGP